MADQDQSAPSAFASGVKSGFSKSVSSAAKGAAA